MTTPKSQPSDFPNRSPDLFYDLARERLSTQLGTIDALDNKIGLLFSLGSALLGIIAAVFAVRTDDFGAAPLALLSAAGLAYCFVAYNGLRGYLHRDWNVGPRLDEVWADQWSKRDDAVLKWRAATAMWSDYEANVAAQEAKEKALLWVFAAIVIQSLLLAVALVLVAAGV